MILLHGQITLVRSQQSFRICPFVLLLALLLLLLLLFVLHDFRGDLKRGEVDQEEFFFHRIGENVQRIVPGFQHFLGPQIRVDEFGIFVLP